MKKGISIFLFVVMGMSVLVFWGCPKKAEMASAPESEQQSPQQAGSVGESKSADAQESASKETAAAAGGGLQPVYFDFDASSLRDDAKPVMKANAEWLKAHSGVKIRIEGNCDERGTKEYNQALGQRRAQSAKRYLMDMGVSSNRISLISYGKEKPTCAESTEDCRQKNRRDDFAVASE